MRHNPAGKCTQVKGTFGMDSQLGTNHFTWLSWYHKMNNNNAPIPFIYDFSFSCEIHLQLCAGLKCSCICIEFLLDHLQNNKPEIFWYLPIHSQDKIKVKQDFITRLFPLAFNAQNWIMIIEHQRELNDNVDDLFLYHSSAQETMNTPSIVLFETTL